MIMWAMGVYLSVKLKKIRNVSGPTWNGPPYLEKRQEKELPLFASPEATFRHPRGFVMQRLVSSGMRHRSCSPDVQAATIGVYASRPFDWDWSASGLESRVCGTVGGWGVRAGKIAVRSFRVYRYGGRPAETLFPQQQPRVFALPKEQIVSDLKR